VWVIFLQPAPAIAGTNLLLTKRKAVEREKKAGLSPLFRAGRATRNRLP